MSRVDHDHRRDFEIDQIKGSGDFIDLDGDSGLVKADGREVDADGGVAVGIDHGGGGTGGAAGSGLPLLIGIVSIELGRCETLLVGRDRVGAGAAEAGIAMRFGDFPGSRGARSDHAVGGEQGSYPDGSSNNR